MEERWAEYLEKEVQSPSCLDRHLPEVILTQSALSWGRRIFRPFYTSMAEPFFSSPNAMPGFMAGSSSNFLCY